MEHILSPKVNIPLYSQEIPHFIEPEVSSPLSQQPTTCPYPEPDQSNPCLILYFEESF